jgi:hypothetical protein
VDREDWGEGGDLSVELCGEHAVMKKASKRVVAKKGRMPILSSDGHLLLDTLAI